MSWLTEASVQLDRPDIVFLLLALVLTAAVLWQVSSLRRRVGGARAALLTLLRLTALGALLALYLEPSLRHERRVPYRPSLAVAVDTSMSMGLEDREGRTRLQRVQDLLQSDDFAEITRNYHADYYSFSADASPVSLDGVGELAPEGEWTDIEGALSFIASDSPASLGAIIVFTDGGHGQGGEPAGLSAGDSRVPLVLVGTGGDAVFRDLEVETVDYPGMAFAGRPVTFNVRIRSHGFAGRQVPLVLKEGSRALLSRTLSFAGEETEETLGIEWTPPRPGIYHLAFEIPGQGGETVKENNAKSVTLEVARDKIRMLYVAGRPTWSHRFLRDALKGDPSIDLVTFIILRSAGDAVNVPQDELSLIPFPTRKIFLEELHNFDIVAFDDFSYRLYFPPQYLEKVREFVADGGAFWMIGGGSSFGGGGYAASPLGQVLPVSFEDTSPNQSYVSGPFRAGLTAAGERHPFFQGLEDLDRYDLPVLDGYNVSTAARPGAVTLVSLADDPDQAIMVVGRYEEGRTLGVLSDSLWKWSFEMAGRGQGNLFFLSMVRRAVRWSVGDRLLQPLSVGLERDRLLPGEKLHGTIRVLGEDYLPLEDADLRATLRREGEEPWSVPTTAAAPGVHKISSAVLRPGTYELAVAALVDGREWSESRSVFEVAWPSSEYHAPGLNRTALESIAAGSPGGIVEMDTETRTARQLDGLLAQVAPPYRLEFTERKNLAETAAVAVLLLLLLAAEWAARKKYALD